MRKKRPYMPGAFFHLVTRTHHRRNWFDEELRSYAETVLSACERTSDGRVVAYAIMPNHIHLVVRQGTDHLAAFMQPLLRRLALSVQKKHRFRGYVFQRRYRHRVIRDPQYLRTCIAYVHRNPSKAGLCEHPSDYAWSSYARYATFDVDAARSWLHPLRELFATTPDRSPLRLAQDYAMFADAITQNMQRGVAPAHCTDGDDFWHNTLIKQQRVAEENAKEAQARRSSKRDLRDIVEAGIHRLCPDLTVDAVRMLRGVRIVAIRRELVISAARAGHRGCDIAAYLRMSESNVSTISRSARNALLK